MVMTIRVTASDSGVRERCDRGRGYNGTQSAWADINGRSAAAGVVQRPREPALGACVEPLRRAVLAVVVRRLSVRAAADGELAPHPVAVLGEPEGAAGRDVRDAGAARCEHR